MREGEKGRGKRERWKKMWKRSVERFVLLWNGRKRRRRKREEWDEGKEGTEVGERERRMWKRSVGVFTLL